MEQRSARLTSQSGLP